MSEIELRECPFCRPNDVTFKSSNPERFLGVGWCKCKGCGAESPWVSKQKIEVGKPKWNTRPRQSELEGIIGELVEPQIGSWMSAALDDPNVCDAMKADIRAWFDTLTRARKKLEG